MDYSSKPKYIKCRINSKNITNEEMTKNCIFENQKQAVRNFYKKIDGAMLLLSLWEYDNYSTYHLSSWENSQDKQVMEAMFELEKVFGLYSNFKEFKRVWNAEQYDSGCVISFPKSVVEELQI